MISFILGPLINGPLKCFSCGKLGYDECKEFDSSNPEQVKVCEKGEVCLIYAWDKTQDKKGIASISAIWYLTLVISKFI